MRELALWCRQLGMLLGNGADPVAALTVIESQDFSARIRSMTAEMLTQADSGAAIEDLVASRSDLFPPVCIFALRAGESGKRLSDTLLVLADCLQQGADLGMTFVGSAPETPAEALSLLAPGQPPMVRIVNRIIYDALEQHASQIGVKACPDGRCMEVSYESAGEWEQRAELPIDLLGPICRRVCIMAQINWWSREPALGTLHVGHRGREVAGSVRFMPGEREEGQEVYVSFRSHADEGEPAGSA